MANAELELIKRSQAGDVAAFEKLIQAHQVVAYNIALRILGDREDAKDAAQESMIKIFKNIKTYKGEAEFSTWLYRVVVNTCRDYARKQARHMTYSIDTSIDTDDGQITVDVVDQTKGPQEIMEQKDLQQKVQAAIQELPEQNRTVIVLRDIQGMSYEVIANMLDLPVGTVKSRINRGRDMLKKNLIERRVNAFGLSI